MFGQSQKSDVGGASQLRNPRLSRVAVGQVRVDRFLPMEGASSTFSPSVLIATSSLASFVWARFGASLVVPARTWRDRDININTDTDVGVEINVDIDIHWRYIFRSRLRSM